MKVRIRHIASWERSGAGPETAERASIAVRDRAIEKNRAESGGRAASRDPAQSSKSVMKGPIARVLFGGPDTDVLIEDVPVVVEWRIIRVRTYSAISPERTSSSALLYMHGGGWVRGEPEMTDWWCSRFAKLTGTFVASVDYRLAPQHPFPAAIEDCYEALHWLEVRRELADRLREVVVRRHSQISAAGQICA